MDTFGFWAFEFALKTIVQFYPNSLMFITSQVCIYMEHLDAKCNILFLKYMRGKKKKKCSLFNFLNFRLDREKLYSIFLSPPIKFLMLSLSLLPIRYHYSPQKPPLKYMFGRIRVRIHVHRRRKGEGGGAATEF